MLKKFFTVFLGSLAAIWFSILLFVGIIILAVVTMLGSGKEMSINDRTVLYIELRGEVPERFTTPSIQDVVMGGTPDAIGFDEILEAIELASVDSKIKGIYLRLDGASMGMAMREELRQALQKFKETKWVVAYGDNYSQGDYYTASVANELYLNPSGQLSANGLAASVPFFKNALAKLGVEIQVIKVGTFKSAVEPFILTAMSDSARYQYEVMLSTVWKSYVADVRENLGQKADFDTTFVRMAATPMTYFNSTELVENKLFTAKKYAYEVTQLLKEKTMTPDDEDLRLVNPREYLSTYPDQTMSNIFGKEDHIAVLYAVGDIVDSGTGGIVGDEMAPFIVSMANNEKIRGLVLRINSGGGSAFASEQIWSALEYFKSKDKPFVVSMSDVAASGGYYIACGADRIYADPATITGSIGIFGIIPYAEELLNDKLGIDFSVVETNPNAVFPRIDRPLTEAQHRALERSIHSGYDLFVNRVATGRKMKETEVRRIAEGRVWAGLTAKQIGLVDEMGGLKDALAYMADKTGLDTDDYVAYPSYKMTPLQILLSASDMEAAMRMFSPAATLQTFGLTPSEIREGERMLQRIRSMNTVQAKMEDIRIQ